MAFTFTRDKALNIPFRLLPESGSIFITAIGELYQGSTSDPKKGTPTLLKTADLKTGDVAVLFVNTTLKSVFEADGEPLHGRSFEIETLPGKRSGSGNIYKPVNVWELTR